MKIVSINPKKSRLDFKAYNCFLRLGDKRGNYNVWFQPPSEWFRQVWNPKMGLQIQQGFIERGAKPRGNHYHPHPKAYDFFYFEKGEMLLALENKEGTIQELYNIDSGKVLIFPPFVAHTIHNIGKEVLRFTTFKTWNYEVNSISVSYKIKTNNNNFQKAKEKKFTLPKNGKYGFDKINPIAQKIK